MEITFENVRDIIVDTLSCDAGDVKPETNLIEDLEADSLEIVELSMALFTSGGEQRRGGFHHYFPSGIYLSC